LQLRTTLIEKLFLLKSGWRSCR